jgi:hypothetical protein
MVQQGLSSLDVPCEMGIIALSKHHVSIHLTVVKHVRSNEVGAVYDGQFQQATDQSVENPIILVALYIITVRINLRMIV